MVLRCFENSPVVQAILLDAETGRRAATDSRSELRARIGCRLACELRFVRGAAPAQQHNSKTAI